MKHKRVISALIALSLVMVANLTTDRGVDATSVQAVNTDLMVLTISSLKQINEQVQECAHNSNCNK